MMGVLTEPKIDAHCHVLDPAKFPYNPKIWASNVDGTLALAKAVLARNRLTRWHHRLPIERKAEA